MLYLPRWASRLGKGSWVIGEEVEVVLPWLRSEGDLGSGGTGRGGRPTGKLARKVIFCELRSGGLFLRSRSEELVCASSPNCWETLEIWREIWFLELVFSRQKPSSADFAVIAGGVLPGLSSSMASCSNLLVKFIACCSEETGWEKDL